MSDLKADVWVLAETHDSLTPGEGYDGFQSDQRLPASAQVVLGSRWVTIWVRKTLESIERQVTNSSRTVACEIQTTQGPLIVFGTVMPWYGDIVDVSYSDEVAVQSKDWATLRVNHGAHLCVAGDFNVNIGGNHYYGKKRNREQLELAMKRNGLKVLTNYESTKAIKPDFGIIDHVAVSEEIGTRRGHPTLIEKRNQYDEPLSDHVGVVVKLDLE